MPERKLTAREEMEIIAGTQPDPAPVDPAIAVRRFLLYAGAWDQIHATDATRISMAANYPLTVGDVRVVAKLLREAIGESWDTP